MEGKGFFGKPALWIAVISAVVAGLFSALPFLYENLINTRSLSLRESRSGIVLSDLEKQIHIVEIENTGRVSLKDIEYEFQLNGANIDDVSVDTPIYATDALRTASGFIELSVNELDAGGIIKMSFLLSGQITGKEPDSFARASGVPPSGVIHEGKPEGAFQKLLQEPLAIFAVLISYALVTGGFVARFRRIIVRPDRADIINFIHRLYFWADESLLRFVDGPTYSQFLDNIYLGWKQGALKHNDAVGAIAGIYVAPRIAGHSKNKALRYLCKLLEEEDEEIVKNRFHPDNKLEPFGQIERIYMDFAALEAAKNSNRFQSALSAETEER